MGYLTHICIKYITAPQIAAHALTGAKGDNMITLWIICAIILGARADAAAARDRAAQSDITAPEGR